MWYGEVPILCGINKYTIRKGGISMGFAERKRWLFFGLPFTFTKYFVEEEILTVRQGLLKVEENDCYIYKIQDVEHSATLFERTPCWL